MPEICSTCNEEFGWRDPAKSEWSVGYNGPMWKCPTCNNVFYGESFSCSHTYGGETIVHRKGSVIPEWALLPGKNGWEPWKKNG